jgi:hypothetical protein
MPAGGDTTHITLLVDFLNTIDPESGAEELGDDRALAAWLRAHGLPNRGADAREARAVRDALRAAADGTPLRQGVLRGIPLHLRIGDDGDVALESKHPLGAIVAEVVRLGHEGEWTRIKICDMHSCREAFYDTSRNRSGRWCDMRVCGNRAKTRAFRDRQRT